MTLTKDQIIAILPGVAHLDEYLPYLLAGMDRYQITQTPQRAGAYLAQIGEESDKFRSLVEYASGAAYEGRADLGDTQSGDGIRFKGRGPIQLTGRSMYAWASKDVYGDDRLVGTPALLQEPEAGFLCSAWFWTIAKHLNPIADLPEAWIHPGPHQYSKFQWITELVNGGQNGYADRLANYNRAKIVLGF